MCVDRRKPRPLSTVYMPAEQKARIMDDLRKFIASRSWYQERGVPWRRGYLFTGPPGTGKTTIIGVCAGAIGRSVYSLNLNNVKSDSELVTAFNEVDQHSVLVIEDIDAVDITEDRKEVEKRKRLPGDKGEKDKSGITLSGLLNAMDGLSARDGRITFLTSNHPEKLDPALVRDGRVDVSEEIGPLGATEAAAMVVAFDADPAILNGVDLPITAAKLQSILLKARDQVA